MSGLKHHRQCATQDPSTPENTCDCEARSSLDPVTCYAAEHVTDKELDEIEYEIGMGAGAWDCEDPKKIIAACWNALNRKRLNPQAEGQPGSATRKDQ